MTTIKTKQLRNGTWQWTARTDRFEMAGEGYKTEAEARKDGERDVAEAEGRGQK